MQIFRQMATQWYVGWHGRTGLNYPSLYPLIDRTATSDEDWNSILADVQWMTTAEKVTHEAHYQANKDGSFDFTWPEDGVVRTCGYATCPLPVRDEVAGMWLVTVKLAEV